MLKSKIKSKYQFFDEKKQKTSDSIDLYLIYNKKQCHKRQRKITYSLKILVFYFVVQKKVLNFIIHKGT